MGRPSTVEAIPIAKGRDGALRITGTRVTLDTIIGSYRDGATPEEISESYPSVPLADIYYVIGYYLRHQAELNDYLENRQRDAEAIRKKCERRWPPEGIRARLLARRLDEPVK